MQLQNTGHRRSTKFKIINVRFLGDSVTTRKVHIINISTTLDQSFVARELDGVVASNKITSGTHCQHWTTESRCLESTRHNTTKKL